MHSNARTGTPGSNKYLRWLKITLAFYGITGIVLYYLQERILFRPLPLDAAEPYHFKIPFRELNIPFDAATNISIVQFLSTAPVRKGVVLYFHGNRQNIAWYAKYAPAFTKHGYEVWMIDYPGFGKSTGPFTEQRLYSFAGQLYKLARITCAKDSIIIYGKSLGTGIAAYLASVRDCKALLLETPYYSMHSLAGFFAPIYPVSRLVRYRLPVYEYLPKVTVPVTIFHGTADWVIPYANAKRLKPLLKPGDAFITIEGGSHNDLYSFPLMQQKLDALLEK